MHYQSRQEIFTALCNGFQQNKSTLKNYLVGISGIDCAGKSTLADQLARDLQTQEIPVQVISGDDFLFPKEIRDAHLDPAYGYYNESFNYQKLFNDILISVKHSLSFERNLTVLDLLNNQMVDERLKIEGPCVVLVEGVFLFKLDLPEVFDYKIWIDLSFEEGLFRATRRARDLIHYKNLDALKDRYLNRLYRGQILHLERDRPLEHCQAVTKIVCEEYERFKERGNHE